MKSRYLISAPLVVGGRGNVALHSAVIGYLNDRLTHHDGGEVMLTRDEIEAHLRANPRWHRAPQLRDQLQGVMVRLSERGQVIPVKAFAGQTKHTVIETDATQRAFLERMVEGVDRIAARDPTALAEGALQAEQIVNDPSRVRRLLTRGFGSSKLVSNPVTRAEKQRRVLAALAESDGMTSEQLVALLSPDLNKGLVAGVLAELSREGRVRGEKQQDGPYKLWSLA